MEQFDDQPTNPTSRPVNPYEVYNYIMDESKSPAEIKAEVAAKKAGPMAVDVWIDGTPENMESDQPLHPRARD